MSTININNSNISTQAFIIWDEHNNIDESSDISANVTIDTHDVAYDSYIFSLCNPSCELDDLRITSINNWFYGTIYVNDFHSNGSYYAKKSLKAFEFT